jgi:hypothetical protein
MRKRKAPCAECGRMTSVSASGELHKHKHPGWKKACPGRKPAEALPVEPPPGTDPLW